MRRQTIKLLESESNSKETKQFMTNKEISLRNRIIAMLQDDGHGHHYPKYAERLKNFIFKIVPISIANEMGITAGMAYEKGTIIINEGFTNNPTAFGQLSVLMRHELAHALMMHQIRMTNKLATQFNSKESIAEMTLSKSMQHIQNIIMDMEISSSGRYTEADKETVRHMTLNGEIIGGLLTEDIRPNWTKMSLEEMYDALTQEIESIKGQLAAANGDEWYVNKNDYMNRQILALVKIYSDTKSVSQIEMPLEKFMKTRLYTKISPELKKAFEAVYKEYSQSKYTQADIEKLMADLAASHPLKEFIFVADDGTEVAKVYSPESKFFIMEELKVLAKKTVWDLAYDIWYNKVIEVLTQLNMSVDDIEKIYNAVK